MASAPNNTESTLASFIWNNANDLWGDFPHTEFGKIILPFTVLLIRQLNIEMFMQHTSPSDL